MGIPTGRAGDGAVTGGSRRTGVTPRQPPSARAITSLASASVIMWPPYFSVPFKCVRRLCAKVVWVLQFGHWYIMRPFLGWS